jgi:phenylacetic acid degradation operon negative regulatory protein
MISAFGDSIAPYSEGIWLGDFIALLAPLGLNERLVRSSAFRLVEEGWLSARRDGRRSHYSLTKNGAARFEAAFGHIYTPPEESWDGLWTIVLFPRNGESSSDRLELKRELEWAGFSASAAGVLLHPTVSAQEALRMIERFGSNDQVVVMRGQVAEAFGGERGTALLSRGWDLGAAEERYERFIGRFEPLMPKLDPGITPLQSFLVQTLLIHSFRRASLQDPRLPMPMLPADWVGLRAFRLCREIYARTHASTLRHLKSLPGLQISDAKGGRLRMPVAERFGGIRK